MPSPPLEPQLRKSPSLHLTFFLLNSFFVRLAPFSLPPVLHPTLPHSLSIHPRLPPSLLTPPPRPPGVLMGGTQIPVLFTVGDSLGSSSSYCTAISMVAKAVGADRSLPYFTRFYRGIGNWWQVRIYMQIYHSAYIHTLEGTIYYIALYMYRVYIRTSSAVYESALLMKHKHHVQVDFQARKCDFLGNG